VVAKLYSFRAADRQDLISDAVLRELDWDLLAHLALDENEAKASALNERAYQDFLYDYGQYVRMYGPHERTDV
jgi:transglutaminase-like putative cysteine protease